MYFFKFYCKSREEELLLINSDKTHLKKYTFKKITEKEIQIYYFLEKQNDINYNKTIKISNNTIMNNV